MLTLYSFLQQAFLFVRGLVVKAARSDYRDKVVMVCAGLVCAVVTLTSGGFGGGGKNALTVFAETASSIMEEEMPEEDEVITEAEVQIELTDSIREGQQIVGDLLKEDIRGQEEDQIEITEKRQMLQVEIQDVEVTDAVSAAGEAAVIYAGRGKIKKGEESQTEQLQAEQEVSGMVQYSEDDYQVLLKIVQAEAGICDEKGKILVANVVLNRVKSSAFPDTIREVVYQRSQFSPVSNGSINTCKVTEETIDCVNRALNGEDYSEGALYFMYRSGSTSRSARWFDTHLTYLFSYERHEFFK